LQPHTIHFPCAPGYWFPPSVSLTWFTRCLELALNHFDDSLSFALSRSNNIFRAFWLVAIPSFLSWQIVVILDFWGSSG
jgi:hypothetical protein